MRHFLKSHHPVRHAKSFKYAFEGILHALVHEPNFRVQLVIVAVSTWLGFYFKISNIEWGLLIISMGLLLAAEMLNTVVEEFMDHLIKDYSQGVKIIKDCAAGFVLITALTTLAILVLIFGHRVDILLFS
jgi:diacylglycerol kinase